MEFELTCYYPLSARVVSRTAETRKQIVFDRVLSTLPVGAGLPCGRCYGCKLEYARQWAMRCVHESELYDDNCSITLTYDDEHLPKDGSLPEYERGDFQLFMKRFRKRIGVPVRFFACGEYGEKNLRPHYHACLFGYDFPDKVLVDKSPTGFPLYQSNILDKSWGLGRARVGDMSFDSASYVARYCLKKVSRTVSGLRPEFVVMSRRPGIGADWFKKFSSDVFPGDFVVVNGVKTRPPKFYNSLYELSNPREFADLKDIRSKAGFDRRGELAPSRLRVREFCKKEKLKLLRRSMEDSHED